VVHEIQEKADIVRIGLQKIRVPSIRYGIIAPRSAPAAPVNGASKAGEALRHIDVIKEFIEAWMDTASARAIEAIKQLPGGTFVYCVSRSVPASPTRASRVKAKVTIDNKRG